MHDARRRSCELSALLTDVRRPKGICDSRYVSPEPHGLTAAPIPGPRVSPSTTQKTGTAVQQTGCAAGGLAHALSSFCGVRAGTPSADPGRQGHPRLTGSVWVALAREERLLCSSGDLSTLPCSLGAEQCCIQGDCAHIVVAEAAALLWPELMALSVP